MRIVVAAVAALLLITGCSHIPGMGSKAVASPSAQAAATPPGTPLARATGPLHAEVAMPSGFPSDVPVYPKARLTAGAQFVSSGEVAYGMEWETTDATSNVWAFYDKEFTTADWTLNVTSTTNGVYQGTIGRRTNSNEKGVLAVNNDNAITVIALSLSSAS
jgi:anaerobic selenocysteine-containing dehydrogenase